VRGHGDVIARVGRLGALDSADQRT